MRRKRLRRQQGGAGGRAVERLALTRGIVVLLLQGVPAVSGVGLGGVERLQRDLRDRGDGAGEEGGAGGGGGRGALSCSHSD